MAHRSFDREPRQRLVAGRVALIGEAGHAMPSSQARGLAAYAAECLPALLRDQQRSGSISACTGAIRPPQTTTLTAC